jgi:hypothetical protein
LSPAEFVSSKSSLVRTWISSIARLTKARCGPLQDAHARPNCIEPALIFP